MQESDPHEHSTPLQRLRPLWPRLAAVLLGAVPLLLVRLAVREPPREAEATFDPAARGMMVALPPTPEPAPLFTAPSPQTAWREIDNPKVYMPTGSGRVVSAAYGSVRTSSSGLASFHEGVDIAPVRWERGRSADDVFAVAAGRVGYINRSGGNSSYGKYVVIVHPDPVGEVVSLYAHLASVPDGLREGQAVDLGEVIGRMGHSSTLGVPPQRSHLHLEMGVMLNRRFARWFASKGLTPSHGMYHGWNISGFNPARLLFKLADTDPTPFSYLRTLREIPVAWRIVTTAKALPDYFVRHPDLWKGPAFTGGALVLEVSESGIPLSGRAATDDEVLSLGSDSHRILEVDEQVLGRNGFRHVRKSGSTWRLGRNGLQWRDILLHGAGT